MNRTDPYGHHLKKGEYYRICDGRYEFRYKDIFNESKCFYENSLTLLRKRIDEYSKDIAIGLDVGKKYTFTLNQLVKEYLDQKTSLKTKTLNNYLYTHECYIKNTIGRYKLTNLSYSMIFNFYVTLVEQKRLSISTLQNVNSVLHSALEYAVKNEILQKNISDGAFNSVREKYNFKSNPRKGLSIAEHKAFLNCLENSNACWKLLFTFLLHTGCRIGEAIGLSWANVDFNSKTITIDHSMCYTHLKETNTFNFIINTPKTESGYRKIPMTKVLCETLQTEYNRQVNEGFSEAKIGIYESFVFFNRNGQPHNPTTINRALVRMVKKYNQQETLNASYEKRPPLLLPHISCHILRHTFCSRLCENETNVKFIQEIMGHSDIQTTMDIYARLDDSVKQEKFNTLDAYNIFCPS